MIGKLTDKTDSPNFGLITGIKSEPKVTKIAKNPHLRSPHILNSILSVLFQKSISLVKYCLMINGICSTPYAHLLICRYWFWKVFKRVISWTASAEIGRKWGM